MLKTVSLSKQPSIITESNTNKIVNDFSAALAYSDIDTLRKVISPKGLVIIRNFGSGNGTRGKDVRTLYSAKDIPNDLKFPVSEETPVDLKWLFSGTAKKAPNVNSKNDAKQKPFRFLDNTTSNTAGPPTQEIRDKCSALTSDPTFEPKAFVLGNELVLTESELADDIPDGGWAVFEKDGDRYVLRAIIDLR
ncbi:MAG: hypothetical protein ACM3UZ_00335, partial [Acidobacteriota bacterium]